MYGELRYVKDKKQLEFEKIYNFGENEIKYEK